MQGLMSGFTIKGRYSIVEKRGQGILGTIIYLGRDLEKNCDVIIRIIPQDLLDDGEAISRFNQGTNIAQKLKHPNILTALDAGEENGMKYLITDYKKGFFLNDYLEHRGQLDEAESIRLIKALSEALNYAWQEQQIIHRNVSPETILVGKGNIPMLTDFDLAKSLVINTTLTVTGFTIGNPMYMSPEQARGDQVDFHSDIYCLGLIFYQLLAGKPPFYDQSQFDLLQAQIMQAHAPIQTQNKLITHPCSTVLDKMLAKEAKDRYQSWQEVINDLDALLNNREPSTLKSEKPSQSATSSYKMQAFQAETTNAKSKTPPLASNTRKISPALITSIAAAIIIGFATIYILSQKDKNTTTINKTEQSIPSSPKTVHTQHKPETEKMVFLPKQTKTPKKAIINQNTKADSPLLAILKKKSTEKVAPKQIVTTITKQTSKPKTISKEIKQAKTEPAPSPKKAAKNVEAIIHNQRQTCLNNIKQINTALQMYANVFEGKYPKLSGAKGLDLLRSNGFLEVPQVFISPLTGNLAATPNQPISEANCDFVYKGGLTESSPSTTPILWTKPQSHKTYGIILYVNGEIKECQGSNWHAQLKQHQKQAN